MNATTTPYERPARPDGGPGSDPVAGPNLVEVLAGRLGAFSGAAAEPDRTAADTSSFSKFTGFCWVGPVGAGSPC